ncbi:MAG: hypothetical protein JWO85_1355 [Candidatus Eremiobacteraeota bacterium]|jgi:hypothetical protein|nr:hypothetical protein [Candidatus Eremiobacteraeota bacterium]
MVNASVVYWIDVRNPASWRAPDFGYVEDALFDAQRDQAIVSSYNVVRAFNSDGAVLWEVNDDGFDGMRFSTIEGSTLRGTGDSIWAPESSEFLIDVANGVRIR